MPTSSASAVATDMIDTTCMVCGLASDPFLVLLCDGCENEAHLACAGLSHVPDGEWFCSSCCRPRHHKRAKAAHSRAAPAKPASYSRGFRREPGEVEEIDGITIEAFADEDSDFQPTPRSQKRHQYQGTSQPQLRSQSRSQPGPRPRSEAGLQSQSQPRPFRHQLLFSSTCVENSGTMQAHGVAAGAALEDFEEQQEAERSDEKHPKKRKKRLKPKPCPLDLSEVPMHLAPIPSDTPGSASRFKGVYKNKKKWRATIHIVSEGGDVSLGTFD